MMSNSLVVSMLVIMCIHTAYSQKLTGGGNPLLVFANRKDVRIVDAGRSRGNSTIVAANLEDAAAVDFLYDDRSIFFTDISQEKIKRTWFWGNDSECIIDVITTGLTSPDGLVCDWLGEKLYWTDSETKRIEVANLDGTFRKVLHWNDLDKPRAIALDPLNGYMYWTDWGEVPKIERAGMDGSPFQRSIIIKENIKWPNGLTLDYEDSRIYWTDAKLAFIHSCNFDGSGRRVVIAGDLPHPFSLTLYDRTLYWTDWSDQAIHSCDKITGSSRKTIHQNIYSPMDIKSFSARRQPKGRNENMCNVHNGGCSHLCLISPVHPFYACACPTGIKLKPDNKTCNEGYEQLLLLARRTDLRRISLDTPDYTDVVLELKEVKHAIAIDYDPVDNHVYWTDDDVQAIWRAYLDGSGQEKVLNNSLIHPDGIAVDWISRNLYWTDTGTDRIEVSRLNGTSRMVVIDDNLDEPRAISLDPISGYMYWTDWGTKPRIERAHLDGSSRVALVNSSLGWPNGIAVDHKEQKIYWGDAKLDKIEVANYDGTGRRVLVNKELSHLFGFGLLGDYIYWTDWQKRSIQRVNKKSSADRKTIVAQLPDLMGLKAVNLVKIEGTNPCAKNNGGCSHLCLMSAKPYKPVCACPMGFELSGNSKTCIVPDAFIIFSAQHNIKRLSLEASHRTTLIPIQGIKEALAIDFDICDNRIYWADGNLKTINRALLNGSNVEVIIRYGVLLPEDIAVDWVSKNIYWVDTGSKRIEVARTDGSSRRVIVWKDLHQPRALAIDPANGHMYWTEYSDQGRIERAALDGTGRVVIVQNIGKVHAITLDFREMKMYWASIDRGMIESAYINGTNRTEIVTKIPKPMGLTLYNDFIFWADWKQQAIEKANKSNGNNKTTLRDSMGVVMDILIYHLSRQAGTNDCHDNNGGCSHLCLAHPIVEGKKLSHHCACTTHYKLNTDNSTCSAPKTFLLFSQKDVINRLVIDDDDLDHHIPEVVLPIPHLRNIKGLAYDPVDNYIYWIEGGKQNVIKRSTDNGTNVFVVVHNDNKEYKPYDMAIDPYARVIYWTCAKRNVIDVTRLDGTPVGVVIQGDREKPRSVVLDSLKGHIYWVNAVQPPTIERAMMDGTERMSLFSKALGKPGPLAVDVHNGKLYWADRSLNRIECSDLDGGFRKILVDEIASQKGMVILGKYLYWIDGDRMLISRANKNTGKDRMHIQSHTQMHRDLHVAFDLLPNQQKHPCAKNNGGCSHICVAKGGRSSRCSCPIDLVLNTDEKTCSDPPTCSRNEFACLSGILNCIPRVWRCDNVAECEDGSDELNCPLKDVTQVKAVNREKIITGTPIFKHTGGLSANIGAMHNWPNGAKLGGHINGNLNAGSIIKGFGIKGSTPIGKSGWTVGGHYNNRFGGRPDYGVRIGWRKTFRRRSLKCQIRCRTTCKNDFDCFRGCITNLCG